MDQVDHPGLIAIEVVVWHPGLIAAEVVGQSPVIIYGLAVVHLYSVLRGSALLASGCSRVHLKCAFISIFSPPSHISESTKKRFSLRSLGESNSVFPGYSHSFQITLFPFCKRECCFFSSLPTEQELPYIKPSFPSPLEMFLFRGGSTLLSPGARSLWALS